MGDLIRTLCLRHLVALVEIIIPTVYLSGAIFYQYFSNKYLERLHCFTCLCLTVCKVYTVCCYLL